MYSKRTYRSTLNYDSPLSNVITPQLCNKGIMMKLYPSGTTTKQPLKMRIPISTRQNNHRIEHFSIISYQHWRINKVESSSTLS